MRSTPCVYGTRLPSSSMRRFRVGEGSSQPVPLDGTDEWVVAQELPNATRATRRSGRQTRKEFLEAIAGRIGSIACGLEPLEVRSAQGSPAREETQRRAQEREQEPGADEAERERGLPSRGRDEPRGDRAALGRLDRGPRQALLRRDAARPGQDEFVGRARAQDQRVPRMLLELRRERPLGCPRTLAQRGPGGAPPAAPPGPRPARPAPPSRPR